MSVNAVHAGGRPDLVDASLLAGREYVPNEMLVQFKPGTTDTQKRVAMARVGAARLETVVAANRRSDGRGDLELVMLPNGAFVSQAMRAVGADAAVEFAEPNWIYRKQVISNDPYVTGGSLWGMGDGFGIGATTAWANNKFDCGSVWVGIIDEGYMYSHLDLAANAAKNPGEIAGSKLDEDSNGYIDDVYGWDFAGNNATVYDGASDDHGTHVAGTIGGVGGNGIGVAGVCWKVNLMNAKFLGNNGGTTANAIKAVDYFTDFKGRHGKNLVATNNSWGGGGFSQGLKDAIDRAGAKEILFVAAAGNDGSNNDSTARYPSGYASGNIIAVASITSSGALSSFSNYGATTVDIGAPGSSIVSTVPGKGGASGYAAYSGTSMATPHVTGAAALYAALNPGASASQIKAAILTSATPTSALAGKVLTGGRLNVSGFQTIP